VAWFEGGFASTLDKVVKVGDKGVQIVVVLPPGHAGELPQLGDCCDCAPEWRCDPHDACFIHDSCFCDGSGSWPPVKPVRSYWCRFSSDWKAAMESPSRPLPFP
jgi:hypothetical protein